MASPYRPPYTANKHRSSFNMASQSTRTSETSGSASVDSLPPPGQRTFVDTFSSIHGLGRGTNLGLSLEETCPQPFGLLKFYTDSDGPWIPLSKPVTDPRPDDSRGRNPALNLPYVPSFNGFRETAASDCETIGPGVLMSDSGYGSQHKASVGIPSQYGGDIDRNMETQSIVGHFSEVHLDPRMHKRPWGQHSTTQSQSGADRLVCQDCNKPVKNKSELTKHRNRHTKPFRCDVEGCPRNQGFSTKNDLVRHQESVHNHDGVKFRCNINSCKNKGKLWPRPDNFRQHLRRVHNRIVPADDEELRSFLYTPPQQEEADRNCVQTASTGMEENALSSSNWAGMDPQPEDAMGLGDMSSPGRIDQHENNSQYSGDDHVLEGPNFSLDSGPDCQDDDQRRSLDAMPEDNLQFEHMMSSISEAAPQSRDSRSPTREETTMSDISCIRPDVLSHTSFSQQLRDGFDGHPKLLELASEGSGASSPNYERDFHKTGPTAELSSKNYREKHRIDAYQPESRLPTDVLGSKKSPPSSVDLRSPEAKASCIDEESIAGDSPLAEPNSSIDVLESIDLDDDFKANKILQALHQKGLLEKYMDQFGYQKAKESSAKSKKATASSALVNENQVRCTACSKTFNRKCELKKHMKRHEKPYGCTSPGCAKRFGSKNDWKRHENSQHFQLEMWKCGEPLKDSSAPCHKVCHRRETFKHHLQKDHDIKDANTIERKLEECRLGRNCEARFWCGFCEQMIEIKQKGGPAWAERFDHIDAHFTGKDGAKKDIKEWKGVDPDHHPDMEDGTSSSDSGSRPGSPEPNQADFGGKHSSTAVVASTSTKRPRYDSDDHERSLKRQRGTAWYCCFCQNQNSTASNPTCIECSRAICESCQVE